MNTSIHSGTALITGASSSIGAVYADRLARRGHDLILVARDRDRLCALAARITDHTGRSVEVLAADLGTIEGLRSVERVLTTDASMTMLVNNAGSEAAASSLLDCDPDEMGRMIDLHVTAPTRLACVTCPGFAARRHGTIINIASIGADQLGTVTAGAKAFVRAFSQSLHHEMASKGIRAQAVLLGGPAIEFWDTAGTPLGRLTSRMVISVADMVDAALAALDRGETVTIPSLPDVAQ